MKHLPRDVLFHPKSNHFIRLGATAPIIRMLDRAEQPAHAPWVKTERHSSVIVLKFGLDEEVNNYWTVPLLSSLYRALDHASTCQDVKALVLMGNGHIFSGGVNLWPQTQSLSSLIDSLPPYPMLPTPSNMLHCIRDENQRLFQAFIDFPKPIVAAVNGPASGAAASTALFLADHVVSADHATFCLKSALPPVGCASVLLAERLGETRAESILQASSHTEIDAYDAHSLGLVDVVVPASQSLHAYPSSALLPTAIAAAEALVAAGVGTQRMDNANRLAGINAAESANLANSMASLRILHELSGNNMPTVLDSLDAIFITLARSLSGLKQLLAQGRISFNTRVKNAVLQSVQRMPLTTDHRRALLSLHAWGNESAAHHVPHRGGSDVERLALSRIQFAHVSGEDCRDITKFQELPVPPSKRLNLR